MSETLQWAQPANGGFEQSGAWLANGSSSTDMPTAATAVQFATGSSTAYTVSGAGTAASLASLDLLTLTGTVDVGGPLSVGGGTLAMAGSLAAGEVAIGAGTVVVDGVSGTNPNLVPATLASTGARRYAASRSCSFSRACTHDSAAR